ncbi:MAG: T9SS type A sorting domain-containing protein, partial [Methanosarcinaceae archaeon]
FNEQGENWKINSQVGDPEPSAEFTWDPLLEIDYTSTLTSNPIMADMLTEGDIFFDFDIKLDDRNSTGEEKLLVEVYNGSTWNQVAEFVNDGSFDFTSSNINITGHAMGRVFRVRFNAVGQNSFDIVSWFVDNIHIYRECAAPIDLLGEEVWVDTMQQDVAEICWEVYIPEPVSQWFYYDDESIEYVWGSTSDWDADVAIKVDAADLVDFEGAAVTQYRAFVDSRLMGVGTVSVKVYQGDSPDPSVPMYEEDVTDQFVAGDDWNDFIFSAAVPIDHTQALWIGLYFTGPADTYGPGITADMGVYDPNGDLYWEAGAWANLTGVGINNRAWLLRGYVTTVYGSTVALGGTATPSPVLSGLATAGDLAKTDADLSAIHLTPERELDGFNIFRKEEGGEYALLTTVAAEPGVSSYCYRDADVTFPTGYFYQVTALYLSETDACESGPAMAYELPMDDFVYVFITDIGDTEALLTNLYPNPAQDMVTVTSSIPMTRLTVTNYVGQVVYTNEVDDATRVELNTGTYQVGVYLVKIDTDNGVITKRVVISR